MTPSAKLMATTWLVDMECGGNIDKYLNAYPDGGGVWTIAGGSTFMPDGHKVVRGDKVNHTQAINMLGSQIDKWSTTITSCIHVPLSDPWMAMLVSFVHQEGPGSLPGSVLADMINAKLWDRAGRQFNGWVLERINGVLQPVLGIMRRMEAQRLVAANQPMQVTWENVWQLGDASLRPLYDAACKDAAAYRNGNVTWKVIPPVVPTHPNVATSKTLITQTRVVQAPSPTGKSSDDLNQQSLDGTLQLPTSDA